MNSPEHSHPLRGAAMEVVVVWDGGDPKAWVVLRSGVRPVEIAHVLWQACRLPRFISEFSCFFILALDTAHSPLSFGRSRDNENNRGEGERERATN